MNKSKVTERNGKNVHHSVGVLLVDEQQRILLIDRAIEPFGLAGVAGHIDEGEEPLKALGREVGEEVGLKVVDPELLYEEFIDRNWCGAGVTGHWWHLYKARTSGQPTIRQAEVKSAKWYTRDELKGLKFEQVWEYWIIKLGYLE